jgi:hypothetical protein
VPDGHCHLRHRGDAQVGADVNETKVFNAVGTGRCDVLTPGDDGQLSARYTCNGMSETITLSGGVLGSKEHRITVSCDGRLWIDNESWVKRIHFCEHISALRLRVKRQRQELRRLNAKMRLQRLELERERACMREPTKRPEHVTERTMPRGEKAMASIIGEPERDTTTAWERLERALPSLLRSTLGRMSRTRQTELAEFIETERLHGAVQELLMMELIMPQFRFTDTQQVRAWIADRLKARERQVAEREGSG